MKGFLGKEASGRFPEKGSELKISWERRRVEGFLGKADGRFSGKGR